MTSLPGDLKIKFCFTMHALYRRNISIVTCYVYLTSRRRLRYAKMILIITNG